MCIKRDLKTRKGDITGKANSALRTSKRSCLFYTSIKLRHFVMNIRTNQRALKGATHLQQHISWLYPSVCCHSSSLHDRTDVDATISSIITLAHYTDAKKVILLCEEKDGEVRNCDVGTIRAFLWQVDLTHVEGHRDDVEAHGWICDAAEGWGLWEKMWWSYKRHHTNRTAVYTRASLTRSILATLCRRRLRLCLFINWNEELWPVELLSLGTIHQHLTKCVIVKVIWHVQSWPAGVLVLFAVDEGAWLQLAAHHRDAVTPHGCIPHRPFTFRVTVHTRDWRWQMPTEWLVNAVYICNKKCPNMWINSWLDRTRSDKQVYVRREKTYTVLGGAVPRGDSGLVGRLWWSGRILKSRALCTASGGSRNTPGELGWPYFFHQADMALSYFVFGYAHVCLFWFLVLYIEHAQDLCKFVQVWYRVKEWKRGGKYKRVL